MVLEAGSPRPGSIDSVSGEDSTWLADVAFSLCVRVAFLCCVHVEREDSLPFLRKPPILLDQGPTLLTSFNFLTS